MFDRLRRLLEMIRFSHTLFALPFALLAAVMAWSAPLRDQSPPPSFRGRHLLGILICMVAARSAAMAFNRLADRRWDAENPRTANRHLPSGQLTARSVGWFTAASSVAFLAGAWLFWPNWLPAALSLPVLAVLLSYSWTKRFTALAHFWLGGSLMLAPCCVWIALRGEAVLEDPVDLLPALWLGAAVLLWVAGFDIIYSCQDVAFDVEARLRSVPAWLGVRGALRLAAACHLGMAALLATLPVVCPHLQMGWIYGSGVAAVAALLLYEHWLVRPDDLTRVNMAFAQVNMVISVGLLLVGAADLLW